MLIQELRPKSFKEIKGNVTPVKALKVIAKDPMNKPTSIILQGERGCGKSSLARIFGRAINCSKKDGDCCNNCDSCLSTLSGNAMYKEYDCSMVGNVEDLNLIKQDFYCSFTEGFRVVLLDENHLMSKQSQASLLKVLEDPPKGLFILFASTDPDKILDTIKSRSLILNIPALTDKDIEEIIISSCKIKSIEIDQDTIKIIVRRAKGHARDSLSLLDKYLLLGKDDFLADTKILDKTLKNFLGNCIKGNVESAKDLVDEIVKNPVMYIEQDFDSFIKEMSDLVFIEKKAPNQVKELIFEYMKYKRHINDTISWYSFLVYMIDKLIVKRV